MNTVYCPNCGQRNEKHNLVCRHCGRKVYQIPANKNFYCISCGSSVRFGTNVCPNCDFDFSRIESIAPGVKGAKIAGETVHAENKSIFMQKGLFVVLGLILVIIWGISLFMPWIGKYNLISYSHFAATLPFKNFWTILASIWAYLPFVAVILAIISVIRKRVYSLVTYTSFAIPWIIGFAILHCIIGGFITGIICSGEILFVVCIALFFVYDRLLYLLNITRN
ncbi:MAG: zinc ribbon domain-containing protein [Armatimonadetes bacterium]|nr:zinc ribbon domain-containing protein [Candidatus Hippobium faecium]